MIVRIVVSLFACSLFLASSAPARAADCAACQTLAEQLKAQEGARAKTADILEKNKAYLAKLSKDETSKRIKVNSNILIATVQLETIANNMSAIQKQAGTKGCQQCNPR